MPGALDKDCIIYLDTKPHPIFINDFIKDMETKDRFGSKTYYEKLREERIAKITELPPKSTTKFVRPPDKSMANLVKQVMVIKKDLIKSNLERKQNDQNTAKDIAAKARKTQKIHR